MGNIQRKSAFSIASLFTILSLAFMARLWAFSETDSDSYLFLPMVSDQTSWITECIDCPTIFGPLSPRAAQLDSSGRPHIVYGGAGLFYSWLTPTDEWQTLTLLSQNTDFATLDLDSADYPHILFGVKDGLRYLYYDGSSWLIEPIPRFTADQRFTIVGYPSLALDVNNQPHISYVEEGADDPRRLVYAYRSGGQWYKIVIDEQESVWTSLALDSKDNPYIAAPGGGGVSIFHKNGIGWIESKVIGALADYPVLVIGSNEELHLVSNSTYLLRDELGWHSEQFDTNEFYSAEMADIALDHQGNPHISYMLLVDGARGSTYYSLAYAYRESGGWVQESGFSSSEYPSFTTIMAGSTGNVQIVIKPRDTLIRYRRDDEWLADVVAESSFAGMPMDFAIGPGDIPHVIYSQGSAGELNHSSKPANTWMKEAAAALSFIPECDGCPGRRAFLDIGQDRRIHISLFDQVVQGLPIYRTRYGIFQAPTLEYVYVGGEPFYHSGSGAFNTDSRNNTHLLDKGKYGYGKYDSISDSYSWEWAEVPLSELFGLEVDHSDRPVIVGGPGLSYATLTESGWVTNTIDSQYISAGSALNPAGTSAYKKFPLDFALDSAGQPHFATYKTSQPYQASYIYFDGSIWQKEIFMREEISVCYRGIAIDQNSDVHIAFIGKKGLAYILREDGSWHIPKVVNRGVGDSRVEWPFEVNCSLALDNSGVPHIVFADSGNIKLSYPRE